MADNKVNNANPKLSRREMIRLLGSASAAGLMGLGPEVLSAATDKSNRERPNIVFILGDNHTYDYMGCAGHPFVQTPNLDRLAREGHRFENTCSPTAICAPSRASILTGCYASTHGVRNIQSPWTYQKTSFLEYLSQEGYDTGFIGKWHIKEADGSGLPKLPFLDLFVSFTYRFGQGAYWNCPLVVNGEETPSRKPYLPEELTDRTIEFIEKQREHEDGSKKPFCVYLSHKSAHPPYKQSPKDLRGIYDDQEIKLPKGIDPMWFGKTDQNVFLGTMMGSFEDQIRGYCETITAMDREIGRLLDSLDKNGLAENTVVIYMGDNGNLWGEHQLHGLKWPYEESIRLPFIMRIPGRTNDAGVDRPQMALNIDVAPTLLELAGIRIPDDMEGESLVSQFQNADTKGREAFLLEYWRFFPERCPTYFGVRTNSQKYVEFEKGYDPWLFNLENDPNENNNLYETPDAQQALPELKKTLEWFKDRQGIS